ncbi:MAG TPA: molybdenum cofactor biosynthesis protein MoaE [Bacteroidota bacterium]|nr:molybdenum cofactor biosynthesis protein MoaE [Bacteroidota bacterium]
MVQITHTEIDVQSVFGSVRSPEAGGIDVFIGTTRNHSGRRIVASLSYEAYEPMALKIMSRLEAEACVRWSLVKVALVHRLGEVPTGEASVVIAVSSAHRHESFEACRFLIDQLKKEVPIWKTEQFADGSVERSGSSHGVESGGVV